MKEISLSNRLLYNRAIIDKLSELVQQNPHLRFTQLLWVTGIIESETDSDGNTKVVDNFYEESERTWNKMTSNPVCFPE